MCEKICYHLTPIVSVFKVSTISGSCYYSQSWAWSSAEITWTETAEYFESSLMKILVTFDVTFGRECLWRIFEWLEGGDKGPFKS